MSRELLKRALESMRRTRSIPTGESIDTMRAIEDELAQPEPEPVAWMWTDGLEVYFENSGDPDHNWVPLYTTPPDQSAQISELIAQRTLQESIIKSAYTSCRELEERLATLQAKRERLSDSKIIEIMGNRFPVETIAFYEGFRAAEEAHGIGE